MALLDAEGLGEGVGDEDGEEAGGGKALGGVSGMTVREREMVMGVGKEEGMGKVNGCPEAEFDTAPFRLILRLFPPYFSPRLVVIYVRLIRLI
jgi:hypothetical protein